MSRSTKAPFKKYEGEKQKDKHVRLTKSMLMSKAYKELKNSSKVLYIYMKLWASGEEEFDFANSLGNKILSHSTIISSIRDLIQKGFIEPVYISNGGGKKPNRYRFSPNWTNKK